MTQTEKETFLLKLEDELLLGCGSELSEWSIFWTRQADLAFCSGANLAAILSAQAAIESHLRHQYFQDSKIKLTFHNIIEQASVPADLKNDLHTIRKYRNKWVHVNEPEADEDFLNYPDKYEAEAEKMAEFAIRVMMRVIFLNQGI